MYFSISQIDSSDTILQTNHLLNIKEFIGVVQEQQTENNSHIANAFTLHITQSPIYIVLFIHPDGIASSIWLKTKNKHKCYGMMYAPFDYGGQYREDKTINPSTFLTDSIIGDAMGFMLLHKSRFKPLKDFIYDIQHFLINGHFKCNIFIGNTLQKQTIPNNPPQQITNTYTPLAIGDNITKRLHLCHETTLSKKYVLYHGVVNIF